MCPRKKLHRLKRKPSMKKLGRQNPFAFFPLWPVCCTSLLFFLLPPPFRQWLFCTVAPPTQETCGKTTYFHFPQKSAVWKRGMEEGRDEKAIFPHEKKGWGKKPRLTVATFKQPHSSTSSLYHPRARIRPEFSLFFPFLVFLSVSPCWPRRRLDNSGKKLGPEFQLFFHPLFLSGPIKENRTISPVSFTFGHKTTKGGDCAASCWYAFFRIFRSCIRSPAIPKGRRKKRRRREKRGKKGVGREANFIPPPFFPLSIFHHSKRLLEIPTKRGEISWRYFFHSTLKKKTRFVGSILHPSYLMREKCLLFPEVS